MEPFTVRHVTLHGHELSYLDSGKGEVLLFIHGILGSHRNWSHLIDRLDDNHRVLVPDLFGHGHSAKPMGDYSLGGHAATLRDLLDRLGIDRVTLVGHSLGGGIAMEFYYLFPERVERLVLVASGGLGREVNPILRSATLPGAEYVLPVIASRWVRGRAESAGRLLSKVGWKPGSDITAIWQGFTSLGDGESRRAFLATTRSVIDPGGQSVSAHDYLPDACPVPTLIVWGSRDRMIPAWHAISAQQAMSQCRVELFQGAGHFPHLDEPDRFADVVRDFVASTRGDQCSDAAGA
ncbi:alpha/beta fold hydrolase [Nocardioides mesophilus]|uniref:Alpha/beta fold hydrolase n=1 Tax=Nocardioides mesophilus TaxID=433659 RepID=A0A7G9RG81_9ACTN|nr:alpha/beta fold hydrolase [Nocardioides mesophilus]QNN54606.1 alpha/beta fold hydrolase [Nocardioides mesophilus]